MTGAARFTEDRLLGGRVRLRQPAPGEGGFRAAIDPVLLAAGVPARPGARLLEAGGGSGAALLCLAARVAGIGGVLVERDAAVAAQARVNVALAGLADRVAVVEGEVADTDLARQLGRFDHGFANPPFWPPGGTPSPAAPRRSATEEAGASLADWAGFLAAALKPRGTVTLVLPAARFDAGAAALRGAGCGAIALLPLWPRAGVAAKRVLLQGVRNGRGPGRVLPGLVLHGADGGYTAEAEAVLRDAAGLAGLA